MTGTSQDEIVEYFQRLGLSGRPLFRDSEAVSPTEHHLMLDGVAGSFALSNSARLIEDDTAFYDWAWSADVAHHVEFISTHTDGLVLVRRWDRPGHIRRFTLESVLRSGQEFIRELEKAGRARELSVIQHALNLFRLVRQNLESPRQLADTEIIRIFHQILIHISTSHASSRHSRRVDYLSKIMSPRLDTLIPDIRIPPGLLSAFLEPEPTTGRILNPKLLLRHAAGALYQEAHLELERVQQGRLFAFLSREKATRTHRDVVYTPPALARLLADKTVQEVQLSGFDRELSFFDPACGSGVFLVELCASIGGNNAKLIGWDVSEAAIEMARLSVAAARTEYSPGSQAELRVVDSLAEKWPAVNAVIMNPPFVAWEDMSDDQRLIVRELFGSAFAGRPDMAMAFVMKAAGCLKPGGVLTTVVPAPLLANTSGKEWRAALLSAFDILLVAHFEGNDLFPSAMVEPAILVMRKRRENSHPSERATVMLRSRSGGAGAAIRALRRRAMSPPGPAGEYELYSTDSRDLDARSISPKSQSLRQVIDSLPRALVRTVQETFSVQQGIRTGANEVFVLSAKDYELLPRSEQRYFRPLAGNRSIRAGRVHPGHWIFFPYSSVGSLFADEGELAKSVPHYYKHWLVPGSSRLKARKGINAERWWELTRPRSWQFQRRPKIISAYFGLAGQFAFDAGGEYVVGQGFAWTIKPSARPQSDEQDAPEEMDAAFRLSLCYLAVLNSQCFEAVLSYYCPSVMGGQFDLSPRFVDPVPIPNLQSELMDTSDIQSLRKIGQRIVSGGWQPSYTHESVVARLYGTHISDWSNVLDTES